MIEEQVLKEIEDLKRVYLKKDKVYEAERKKLLELAEKYVAENDILNDVIGWGNNRNPAVQQITGQAVRASVRSGV